MRYSFDVMESRVCSNCTRYVHRPSTPGKEVNRTENTVRKIATQKATDTATYSKVYACSDIDLGEVLINYVMFCGKENRDLSS